MKGISARIVRTALALLITALAGSASASTLYRGPAILSLAAGLRLGMAVDGQASADISDRFEDVRFGLYALPSAAKMPAGSNPSISSACPPSRPPRCSACSAGSAASPTN